mgnify:CR=1 FL=1
MKIQLLRGVSLPRLVAPGRLTFVAIAALLLAACGGGGGGGGGDNGNTGSGGTPAPTPTPTPPPPANNAPTVSADELTMAAVGGSALMAPWGALYTPEQLEEMADYVMSLRPN